MTMLTAMVILLSACLVMQVIPEIFGSWLLIEEAAAEGDLEALGGLQRQRQEFIIRHMLMALAALGLVAAVKYLPALAGYGETAAAIAFYIALSLAFAFAESILAYRVSGHTTLILQPAKEQSRISR